MKVFEVLTEYLEKDSDKIITERQYVTSFDESIATITQYFAKHCTEYEKELVGVRDVLTIVQHIREEDV